MCKDCAQAASRIWHGYSGGCRGCETRALAASIPFHASVQADALTPAYRNALRSTFGDDWRKGHDDVKDEATRLRAQKEQA